MINTSLLVMKKHIRNNFKNLLINFFAMFLSLFALIATTNIISIENDLHKSILRSYPNQNVYRISKNGSVSEDKNYNIVQKIRPTIQEIKNIDVLNMDIVDIDLSYLLNDYTLKVDGLIKNETISFEPHFMENEIFYCSQIPYDEFDLFFEKEFLVNEDEQNVYETFKWDINNFEKKNVRVFNFLRVPTIFYPYKMLKNAAELTYFSSIDINLYEFILEKSSNEIETNYSLVGVCSLPQYKEFLNSERSQLYDFSSVPIDIANNFMGLFSTVLDFCFYFLIAIVILVVILFLYTIYLMVLKNHKEIALLRTYGMSKSQINSIYRIEISLLYFISFLFAAIFSICVFLILNSYVVPGLNIVFSIKMNVQITLIAFLIGMLSVNLLVQIPLAKVNKINIRKELNSL